MLALLLFASSSLVGARVVSLSQRMPPPSPPSRSQPLPPLFMLSLGDVWMLESLPIGAGVLRAHLGQCPHIGQLDEPTLLSRTSLPASNPRVRLESREEKAAHRKEEDTYAHPHYLGLRRLHIPSLILTIQSSRNFTSVFVDMESHFPSRIHTPVILRATDFHNYPPLLLPYWLK